MYKVLVEWKEKAFDKKVERAMQTQMLKIKLVTDAKQVMKMQ